MEWIRRLVYLIPFKYPAMPDMRVLNDLFQDCKIFPDPHLCTTRRHLLIDVSTCQL